MRQRHFRLQGFKGNHLNDTALFGIHESIGRPSNWELDTLPLSHCRPQTCFKMMNLYCDCTYISKCPTNEQVERNLLREELSHKLKFIGLKLIFMAVIKSFRFLQAFYESANWAPFS